MFKRLLERYPPWFLWVLWGVLFMVCVIHALRINEVLRSDYYPIWWAGQQIMDGQPVYGEPATTTLAATWNNNDWPEKLGYLYPLTTAILSLPFSFLPFSIAHWLWTTFGVAVCFTALYRYQRLAPFLMLAPPWILAVYLGQAHLLATGCVLWWWLAQQAQHYKRGWFLAALTCLIKPQVGIGALIIASWMLIRERQIPRWPMIAIPTIIVASSFLINPNWIGQWLEQISVYDVIIPHRRFAEYIVVIGIIGLFTPWRGILAAYLVTSFVVHYTIIGATVVLLIWRWPWLSAWIIINYMLPPEYAPLAYFPVIIGTCLWHIYHVYRNRDPQQPLLKQLGCIQMLSERPEV